MEHTWIIVPALNQEKSITGVLRDLFSHGFHNIIVVDDGSTDLTGERAEKAGAIVLTHLINRGQGAALRTGIHYALTQNADYLITFDSDGQHQAKDLTPMIHHLHASHADIALGSRFLQENNKIPFSRKILLHGSRVVIYLFYGLWMTDAHNGLRVFSRHAAQRIDIKSDRMEHASEIIGQIRTRHLRFTEVPVTILYTKESLQHGLGGLSGAIRILFKMILQKITR